MDTRSMNFDDTIAVLCSETCQARMVPRLPHNRDRCCFQSSSQLTPSKRKRGDTTALSGPSDAEIILTFSVKPFDPLEGFVFGSDDEKCDVLLHKHRGQDGISGRHFRIQFQWETGCLLLTDLSSKGTIILSAFAGSVAGLARIRIFIPSENERGAGYFAKFKQFRQDYEEAVPRLNGLSLPSPVAQTLLAENKLGLMRELSRGQCGRVFKALDNRGKFYAVKVFDVDQDRSTKSRNVEKIILREIENLIASKHKHIVSVASDKFLDIPQPTLVMEFVAMGTLELHHDLCRDDVFLMFQQLLNAVSHLHEHDFAHRDIKPANILVSSRDPLFIKLSDFGFTSRDPLVTFCGTLQYAAPEIMNKQIHYTKSVDIWSIGVILFEFFHYCCQKDLPSTPDPFNVLTWRWRLLISSSMILQPTWRQIIVLGREMLDPSPQDRPTAQLCLQILNQPNEPRPTRQSTATQFGVGDATPRATSLIVNPDNTTWSSVHFNGTDILILETQQANSNQSKYIINVRNIYQALKVPWNGHLGQNLPRIIVEAAPKGRNGTYISLNIGVTICTRLGNIDLLRKISDFAKNHGASSEIISVKSFSQLKAKFPGSVQIGEYDDLPLAININVLFKANGLNNGHVKKHLPLIRQGPHHAVKRYSTYPPPGVYTTIETAITILKQRQITDTAEQLQEYLDRDLWSPLLLTKTQGEGGAVAHAHATSTNDDGAPTEVEENDGDALPTLLPTYAENFDDFFRDILDEQVF